jgi:hypothetical protein
MNRQFILFSVTGLALIGASAGLAVANAVDQKPNQQQPNQPLCYVQHPNRSQQDLTKICGQSALIPVAPASLLDPNAPVNFNMPRSRTPSALWNTVPDSDQPIELGKTHTPAPSAPSRQPQSPAQAPSGDEGEDSDAD